MKKQHLQLSLIMLLLLSGYQFARTENYYGMANDYLQYGAGARSLAMGGAYVALVNDATAPYWNPAGLMEVEQYQFLCMYAPFLEGTTYNFVSYVHPLRKLGTIGLSDVLLHCGGFDEVRLVEGVVARNKSVYKNGVILSYANKPHPRIAIGVSLKLLHEQVIRYSGNGQGIDLGLLYKPINDLKFGLSLQNVLPPKITLREQPQEYKLNLKAGVSLITLSHRLTIATDVNKLADEKAYFCTGIEICPWLKNTAALQRVDLRAGFNHQQSFTYGIGLKIRFFNLDYAFSSHDLGNLHKFGITFSWGKIYKATAKPALKQEGSPDCKH